MTTFDSNTLEQDTGLLRRIHREFWGRHGPDCSVIIEGQVSVDDPVRLLEAAVAAPRINEGGKRSDACKQGVG
jgi:hypothetical protein